MEAEIARLNKINAEMDREHRAWHRMMEAEIERLKRCNAAMDTEHRAWHRMADKAIALEAERDMALAKVKSMEIALSAAKENLSRKQDELDQSRKWNQKNFEDMVPRDCGQDTVCQTPPGCVRHFMERNRELMELVNENIKMRTVSEDTMFSSSLGTIRKCIDCGCLVAGGPTRCGRCAKDCV